MKLVPAYGRDYTTKKEVEASFFANKDFQVQDFMSSGMTSYKELKQMGVKTAEIRYSKLTKMTIIKI